MVLRGEAAGNARLTEVQIREIRALKATGLSDQSISVRYGVARRTINAIVNRKIWRHVDG
jgi:hypothetical protein